MAYELQAAIACMELLRPVTAEISQARIVPLRQGFGLLPIGDALSKALTDPAAEKMPEFWALPKGFERTLAEWSRRGRVAYVEAEFFGGNGGQVAAVWEGGKLVFGPTEDDTPLSPISQALRRMGATAPGGGDEFDALGLGRERLTEDWLALSPEDG